MKHSASNLRIKLSGAGAAMAVLIGIFPGVSQAQTYYFTQGAATTATNVNTYATDASGIAKFTLGTTTVDFATADQIIQEQDAAVLIHAYVTAGWTTPPNTGNFSLDEDFPSFSGSQALWINPNNAPYIAAVTGPSDPQNVSAWSAGTWQVSITFNISDINLYSDFFIEGRHYGDDVVTATVNGQAFALPSTNTAEDWNYNPPAASSTPLEKSLLLTGNNTIVFTINNTNPEEGTRGPSGLMAYGRVGAVPEPSTLALVGLATLVLFGRRRRS